MKKILISFIGIFTLFLGMNNVYAGASISASANSIYVGNSVTVSVTVTNAAAWEVHLNVSGAASPSNCGGLDFADSTSDTKNTSKTYTVTCTPQKTGTINFSLKNNSNITDETGNTTYISGSTNVSVINKPVVQQPQTPVTTTKPNTNTTVTPKSSVNYLKSLSIEGKVIDPKFDKETAEYTVELENGTTSINILAEAEHGKASVTGNGLKNVSEGINNFEIIVTAENGSKRTYKLKVIVKEKDPIIITLDGKEYTVVRKKENLIEASAFYSESKVNINNEEIPAYFGEVTGYTLVGLKDSEGIINLYTYDEDNNSFKLYQEFNFAKIAFYPTEPDEKLIPENYLKATITINNIEIPCYKNKQNNLVLLYGVNIENNNEDFYIYDSVENTLQRYNDNIFNSYKEEIKLLKTIIIGLLLIVATIITVSALQGSINKNTKKKNKETQNINKQKEEENKENKKEAKLLEKELKRKEKEEKKNKKRKKNLDDTNIIDITNISIKKK